MAALANALKLQNQVIFHAKVPIEELGKILHTMDMGIVSKRNGTFAEAAMSTKLFEFASAGLPAIVSRTSSDSLYFDDSMVLFFEPENERQLADGILKLAQNPAHREALSKNVQSAFDRINWELVKKDFCAVFDRLYLNQAY